MFLRSLHCFETSIEPLVRTKMLWGGALCQEWMDQSAEGYWVCQTGCVGQLFPMRSARTRWSQKKIEIQRAYPYPERRPSWQHLSGVSAVWVSAKKARGAKIFGFTPDIAMCCFQGGWVSRTKQRITLRALVSKKFHVLYGPLFKSIFILNVFHC